MAEKRFDKHSRAAEEDKKGSGGESESFKLSGPGAHSATANHQTHALLELTGTPGGPPYTVAAELKAEVTSKLPGWLRKKPRTDVVVTEKSPSEFLIQYGTASRGKYKLHVQVNGSELQGSPFDVTTYPDPSQLRPHVKDIVSCGSLTWGLALDSQGDFLATSFGFSKIHVINKKGVAVGSMGDKGYGPAQRVKDPMGLTVDPHGNVYVSDEVNVVKFGADGTFLATVGKLGRGNGQFNMPDGIAVYGGEVFVCDKGNSRLQVFDTDLKFKRILTFKTPEGRPRGLSKPSGIDVDASGRAYIADSGNNRIVVLELPTGDFLCEIGHKEGEGKLFNPTGLHVVAEFLYVSDDDNCRDVIYRTTGELVATMPRSHAAGVVKVPRRYTSDRNGFVYSLGSFGLFTTY